MNKTQRITIRVTEEERDRLERYAKLNGYSLSKFIRMILNSEGYDE